MNPCTKPGWCWTPRERHSRWRWQARCLRRGPEGGDGQDASRYRGRGVGVQIPVGTRKVLIASCQAKSLGTQLPLGLLGPAMLRVLKSSEESRVGPEYGQFCLT